MNGDQDDMTNDQEYQAFVEEQAKHCRCSRGPCDGVLAGGMCDDIRDDEDDDLWRFSHPDQDNDHYWDDPLRNFGKARTTQPQPPGPLNAP